jgi:LysW-gamma-L-alpha-aminoadipyl-6-phosphate/LysW-L-glutamyl-5-phosphate reductase
MKTVSIIGCSGYVGGEVLRLLLGHPEVEVKQVTSERLAGKSVTNVHPNLRGRTKLLFSKSDEVEDCDILFLALPHGLAMKKISDFQKLAPKIIDLSADFRLKNPQDYIDWYGHEHASADVLKDFVYGIVELHREEMKTANYISGAGCNATCTILSLYPLVKKGLIDLERPITVEAKVGSSESGNKSNDASHHPERSGAVRSFKATGHRHTAEMLQELSVPEVYFSGTAIEMVRGILTTAHVFLKPGVSEKDVWKAYREVYADESFIRIVKAKTGIYRYPEPKILAGTNYCDIGFEKDPRTDRLVVMAALDNIMKGAAGQAVHGMNVMMGFPENTGLEFFGLHPV